MVKEGHQAKFWIKDPEEKEIAEGFVPKADDWRAEVEWADVVVFDDVLGMGEWAHELRQAGKKVVGGSPYTDRLEDDRAFGQTELRAAGVSIIPQENFTSFDDAMTYVKANPNRYVINPARGTNQSTAALRSRRRRPRLVRCWADYKRPGPTHQGVQLQRRIRE